MYREILLNSLQCADISKPSFNIQPTSCYAFKILEVSFTQNFDSINSSNNTIMFAEGSTVFKATIPSGTYNIGNICATIQAAMNAQSSHVYSVTYNDVTQKISISVNSGTFKILGGNRGTTAWLWSGISQNLPDMGYYPNITLMNPVNLGASSPILLCSQSLSSEFQTYVAGIDSGINCLAMITPDDFGSIITWSNTNGGYCVSGGDTITKLDFSLVDSLSLQTITTNSPITVRLAILDDENDLICASLF